MSKFKDLLGIYRSINRSDLSTLTKGTHAFEHLVGKNLPGEARIRSFADNVLTGDASGRSFPSADAIEKWFRQVSEEPNSGVVSSNGYYYDGKTNNYSNSSSAYSIAAYANPQICKKMLQGSDGSVNLDETRLSAIQCLTPYIGMGTKDTNYVSLFLNVIPTLEMSKATPYLEVNFERLARRGVNAEEYAKAPSLNLFLEGPAGAKSAFNSGDTLAKANVLGLPQDRLKRTPELKNAKQVRTGMEVFTTPQTVRPLKGYNAGRYRNVLDPSMPLMSIKKFDMSVISAKVMTTGFKTATLTVTLHDRSRLAEVTNLISPGAFFDVYLRISYGYKCSDPIVPNDYASILQSMQVKDEIYNIQATDYNFNDDGSVDINIKIGMRGAFEANRVKFMGTKAQEFQSLTQVIDQIKRTIGEKLASVRTTRGSFPAEARGLTILENIVGHGELLPEDAKKQYADVKKFLDQIRTYNPPKTNPPPKQKKNNSQQSKKTKRARQRYAAEIAELSKKFEDFYSAYQGADPPKNGKKVSKTSGVFNQTLDDYVAEAIFSLTNPELPDPFLDPEAEYAVRQGQKFQAMLKDYRDGTKKSKDPKTICSFAKLMLTFAGSPLAQNRTADEVQFVFYPFNDEAGYARGSNIGSFPVDLEIFRQEVRKELKREGISTLTAGAFMNLAITSLIADSASYAYGMRGGYKFGKEGLKEPIKEGKGSLENIQRAMAEDLGTAFRMPTVESFVECKAATSPGAVNTNSLIVRVHFFDKASSTYRIDREIYENQKNIAESLTALSKGKGPTGYLNENSGQAIQASKDVDATLSKFRDNFSALKSYLTRAVPCINYGTNTSNLQQASFKSQQNKQIENVNAIRANSTTNAEPGNASQRGGFPLYVQSAQIDAVAAGCPLLAFGQQFFVDFGTGTTIDGIYLVTNINHSFEPGKYTTSFTMTPNDAYGIFRNTEQELRKLKDILDPEKAKTNLLNMAFN